MKHRRCTCEERGARRVVLRLACAMPFKRGRNTCYLQLHTDLPALPSLPRPPRLPWPAVLCTCIMAPCRHGLPTSKVWRRPEVGLRGAAIQRLRSRACMNQALWEQIMLRRHGELHAP